MKILKKSLVVVLILFIGHTLQAQTNGSTAKDLYQQAENAFRLKNYSKSLDLLNQTQSMLGSNNAMIESLRIKNYYELGEYQKAKTSFDVFFKFSNTADNLLTEMYSYLEKTDAKIKEEQEREVAQQQKAIRDEQDQIEREAKEKKDYKVAVDENTIWKYNQFISTYPNSRYLSDIKHKLDDAYVMQGMEYYNNEDYDNAVKLFEEYISKFQYTGIPVNDSKIKTKLAESYYLLGEKARIQKKNSLAKDYYNKALGIKVYSIHSKYYNDAQNRLKEYKNTELQAQKDNLMAKAIENKEKANEFNSLHRKWVGWGLAGTIIGASGIIYGASGFGAEDEHPTAQAIIPFAFGIPVLIGGSTALILSPKYKRLAREYNAEYLKYKNKADAIKLTFAPIVAPNQMYGLALRVEF